METTVNQTMAITELPIGGTFTCTVKGRTTRAIPFDATKEEVNEYLGEIDSPVIFVSPPVTEKV